LIVKHLAIGFVGIQTDFRLRKVRTVVGIHHLPVILARVALGQEERFGCASFIVNLGHIEFGVHAVVAFRTEHKPSAVTAPVVEALALL
jgi:hypothetical protein